MVTPNSPAIIDARGLVKRYGNTVAVNGVDLQVRQGEIFGILGSNGAGKTTTLEMIEGLRAPDEGVITVAGYDAVTENDAVRRIIGVQLQTTALFDYLTCAELIELFAGLYDVDDSTARIDELLAMVSLKDKRDSRVNQMSGGQQQRLSIALALVNRPLVAFLDEPTTGLDPAARRDLWQTVRHIRDEGATVVLTTHYMEEAEVLCDRVAIMDYGRIIALEEPAALVREMGAAAAVYAGVDRGSLDESKLGKLPAVTASSLVDGQLTLQTTHAQSTLIGLLNMADSAGVELKDLRSTRATLEDVFLGLTGRLYSPADQEEELQEVTRPKRRFGRT